MTEHCDVGVDGPVTTVTMRRDDRRNALDAAMLGELKAAFAAIAARPAPSVVVLAGVGNTFSAGADLSPLKGISDPAERRRVFAPYGARIAELLVEAIEVLLSPNIISIAAVNGHAVGGGWGLALACDFQVAAAEARFWFPEIELGRAVTPLTCRIVTAQAGPRLAREILMTARRYSADALLARGLVDQVVPAQAVPAAAAALAARLAGFDATALALLKRRIGACAFTDAT